MRVPVAIVAIPAVVTNVSREPQHSDVVCEIIRLREVIMNADSSDIADNASSVEVVAAHRNLQLACITTDDTRGSGENIPIADDGSPTQVSVTEVNLVEAAQANRRHETRARLRNS